MSSEKRIMVVGATSAIAEAVLKQYAHKEPCRFFLVARNEEKLAAIASNLKTQYQADVEFCAGDFLDVTNQQEILEVAIRKLGEIDIVLLAWGDLGNANQNKNDPKAAEQMLQVNLNSYVSFLTLLQSYFKDKRSGSICVITSVAGDRGRQRNYVYDCTKGCISIYLQGLRQYLYQYGVHVLTIKPGFVSTPMTAHMKQGLLFASSEVVGSDIRSAIDAKKDVLYTPWFWRYIMLVIKLIPETLFKRLKNI